jgi:hypothetical protein
MSALVTLPGRSPAPSYIPTLLPATMSEAMHLAEMMATARLVPQHLQKSPADCLSVIMQAMRWRMDPFAVAQATAVIQGKLMYEGKLVAAVVNSLGNLSKRLSYRYDGDGADRVVMVSGTLVGETDPLIVYVRLEHARTNNKVWTTQPDQQLAYHGARVWARRYMPELMLGVYAPEEFDAPALRDVTPAKVAPPARPADTPPPPPRGPKPAIKVKVPGGWDPVQFSQDDGLEGALRQAMEFMTGAIIDGGPTIVSMNNKLLDRIAEVVPDMADEVSELRAAAAEALKPADEDETQDTFVSRFVNGDDPEPSDFPGDRPSAGT